MRLDSNVSNQRSVTRHCPGSKLLFRVMIWLRWRILMALSNNRSASVLSDVMLSSFSVTAECFKDSFGVVIVANAHDLARERLKSSSSTSDSTRRPIVVSVDTCSRTAAGVLAKISSLITCGCLLVDINVSLNVCCSVKVNFVVRSNSDLAFGSASISSERFLSRFHSAHDRIASQSVCSKSSKSMQGTSPSSYATIYFFCMLSVRLAMSRRFLTSKVLQRSARKAGSRLGQSLCTIDQSISPVIPPARVRTTMTAMTMR